MRKLIALSILLISMTVSAKHKHGNRHGSHKDCPVHNSHQVNRLEKIKERFHKRQIRKLSEEDKALFEKSTQEFDKAIAPLKETLKTQRKEVKKLIEAEPLDEKKLEAKMDEIAQLKSELHFKQIVHRKKLLEQIPALKEKQERVKKFIKKHKHKRKGSKHSCKCGNTENKALKKEIRKERKALVDLINKEELDQAALKAKVQKIAALEAKVQKKNLKNRKLPDSKSN